MKHTSAAIVAGVSVVVAACLGLQAQGSITRAHVEALAAPRTEGRLAGTNGERLASDYLVAELQKIGAKPLPGQTDFRLPFDFTAGTRDGGSKISVSVTNAPAGGVESGASSSGTARALSFSDNGDADGPVSNHSRSHSSISRCSSAIRAAHAGQ